MTRLKPWGKLPQFRELASKKDFPSAPEVKNQPATQELQEATGSVPRSGRSPEEGMNAHSIILAWRIPRREEPGKLHTRPQKWKQTSPPHSQTPGLRNKANLPFLHPYWFLRGEQCFASKWGCALAISGFQRVSQAEPSAMTACRDGSREAAAADWLAPGGRFGGNIPSSCWSHLFQGSSPCPSCSALVVNLCFSSVEWKNEPGQAE